jgi:hypothetical protein
VLENPVLRDGISFLAPRHAMLLALHESEVLHRYLKSSPVLAPEEPEPPRKPLRVSCDVRYSDGITGRRYAESFTVGVDERHHGWVQSRV